MKWFGKIAFSLFTGLCICTACDDSDDLTVTDFSVDTKEITVGAEGGAEKVNVVSGTKWVAKVNQPWVKVMPANGVGSAECDIVIDTTLSNEVRQAVVTFVADGQTKQDVEVYQTGYGKMIGLSEKEVSVKNMDTYDKRYFEISVTTNVDFKVTIPSDARNWLTLDKTPSVSLDYGARPRTTKIRFNWSMNTDPEIREASIAFEPKNATDTLEQEVVLAVKQDAAPEITDDRTGDSLALIIVGEKLRAMSSWNTSEKMDYWKGVSLWEKTSEGVTPEMIGRVRSVEYRIVNTKEGLPVELGKLRYLEELIVYGNTNTTLLPDDFKMGNALAELEHLKRLQVAAYGLTTIIPYSELKKPKSTLEYLDLSGNNFTDLPSAINEGNFPRLISLSLGGMRRYSSVNDMYTGWRDNAGMKIDASGYAFKNLLKWEKLRELSLSYNYIYGQLPDFKNEYGIKTYTDEQIAANDTLNSASDENKAFLKTVPCILPNARVFSVNLNFLTGELPDWLLYHPRFAIFDPFTLICTQEKGYDPNGVVPGFTNEPTSLDKFYEFYPAAKPTKTE